MYTKDITAPNPQGKGAITLLEDLNSSNVYKAVAKDIPHWLADYFTSLLVLSASFNFKPIMNKPYYLYLDNLEWKLSLIAPNEWSNCPYEYFAKCMLNQDRSWRLNPKDNWNENTKIKNYINSIKKEFLLSLNNDTPLVESLPYCAQHLPYYQRLAAFGLANSLKDSLQLALGYDESRCVSGKKFLKQVSHSEVFKLDNIRYI